MESHQLAGEYQSRRQPRNRAVADIVRPDDFVRRLADVVSLQGLALLVGGQLGLAAHLHPPRLSQLAALAGTRAD